MAFGDGASLLDDFNRADEGPPLSSSWSDTTQGLMVSSNGCIKDDTGSDNGQSSWIAATFGADEEAYVTISTIPGDASANERLGVMVRADATTTNEFDGYLGLATWAQFSAENYALYESTNYTLTLLGSTYSMGEDGWDAGDKIGIDAIGTTIRGFIDEGAGFVERISETDATWDGTSPNDHVGLFAWDHQLGVLDDFYGGDVSSGVAPYPRHRHYRQHVRM